MELLFAFSLGVSFGGGVSILGGLLWNSGS